jgi:hypothetical protein
VIAPLWVLTVDSIYRLHPDQTVERVTGLRPPSERQGVDGHATRYEALTVVEEHLGTVQRVTEPWVGAEVHFTWNVAQGRHTRSSTVLALSESPMFGRSFFMAPPNEDDASGAVLAAGVTVALTPTVEAAFAMAALLTAGSVRHPSGTAIGVASVGSKAQPTLWSAQSSDLVLAEPRSGWRRPWDVPDGLRL